MSFASQCDPIENSVEKQLIRIESQITSQRISSLRAAAIDLREMPIAANTLPFLLAKLEHLLSHTDDRVVGDALETVKKLGPTALSLVPKLLEIYEGDDDELAAHVLRALPDVGYTVGQITESYGNCESHPEVFRGVGLLGLAPEAEGDKRQILQLIVEAFDGIEEPLMDKAAQISRRLPEFKKELVPLLLEYLDRCRGLVDLEIEASKSLTVFETPHGVSEEAFDQLRTDAEIFPKSPTILPFNKVLENLFSTSRPDIADACYALAKGPIGDSGILVKRLGEILEMNDFGLIEPALLAIAAYEQQSADLLDQVKKLRLGATGTFKALVERTIRRIGVDDSEPAATSELPAARTERKKVSPPWPDERIAAYMALDMVVGHVGLLDLTVATAAGLLLAPYVRSLPKLSRKAARALNKKL